MTWWTLYETATGIIRGHTSIQPTSVPAGITVIEHTQRMDQTNRWNATTKAWEPIPAVVMIDRLQDLANHTYLSTVWQALTTAQRTRLRKTLVWLLGPQRRYRQPTEEVALDAPPDWPTDPANAVE